jgi:hypothetical protein
MHQKEGDRPGYDKWDHDHEKDEYRSFFTHFEGTPIHKIGRCQGPICRPGSGACESFCI